ncbi:MAG: REP-associated tyrosine transposase [Adhaeribacter sp.]
MTDQLFTAQRKSAMQLEEIYFWTATVKDWRHLFKPDKYKTILIEVLRELQQKRLFRIYGFVIMPNHVHLIWQLINKNGREMPQASFTKATAHLILEDLKQNHPAVLPYFKVGEKERQYRIWQRDSLAILLFSKHMLEQKLDYLHQNPLQEHWQLADRPEAYRWSSAAYYETGTDAFGFLSHYQKVMP